MVMSHVDYCWRKASEYMQRAEETTDDDVRLLFHRLRDGWISAANRNEMLDALNARVPAVSAIET